MGVIAFASGSYHHGDLGDQHISDRSHEHFEQVIRERGFPVASGAAGGDGGSAVVMAAGDATFHAGWTLHSAPSNQSERMREVITVVYFADGTRTFPDMRNSHREWDFRTYMPGVQPGELAASPLNPVVYRREPPDTQ